MADRFASADGGTGGCEPWKHDNGDREFNRRNERNKMPTLHLTIMCEKCGGRETWPAITPERISITVELIIVGVLRPTTAFCSTCVSPEVKMPAAMLHPERAKAARQAQERAIYHGPPGKVTS
jgi:hypothetical protein